MTLDIPTTPSRLVCTTNPPTSTPASIYLVSQEALCPFKPLRTGVQPLLVGPLIPDELADGWAVRTPWAFC